MRRRSTFLHSPQHDVDPKQLVVTGNTLAIDKLKSAREERLTLGLNELPDEIWQVLQQSHELHIRWQTQTPYNSTAPLVSKVSSGLHVFYTPLKNATPDLLCPMLRKVFSDHLKCDSPMNTFSQPSLLSDRFASTASLQYYSLLPRLNHLVTYLQRKACLHSDLSCIHSVSLLNIADTLDLDYDGIAHALTVSVYWSKPPPILYDPLSDSTTTNAWTLNIGGSEGDKVEVGILQDSQPADSHDVQLGGFLTVVGEDDHPKPTLFQFPSRHHLLPFDQQASQAYTVSFEEPTGLHPTMKISFPDSALLRQPSSKPGDSTCALHAYLALPSVLFADQYQLLTTDNLFLSSHRLIATRSISGATDLEGPDYIIDKWGSNLLLELATPSGSHEPRSNEPWEVTVPLHLRYLEPAPAGRHQVSIPWPVVFWACTAEEGTKFPSNPFDRTNLGYDGLFGPRTMFYHLSTKPKASGSGTLVEFLTVPVLNTDVVGQEVVEVGTMIVILAGFFWVVWKLWPGLSKQILGPEEQLTLRKRQ